MSISASAGSQANPHGQSMFEGDNAAQAQWLNAHGARKNAEFEPYQRAMFAVFRHTLGDLKRGNQIKTVAGMIFSKRKDMIYQEALAWVNDEQADGPFSFGSICEVLGLEAASARFRLVNGMFGEVQRSLPVSASREKMISNTYDRDYKRSHARRKVMA